jgi:tetratricopeptide (TPR) repeat protein
MTAALLALLRRRSVDRAPANVRARAALIVLAVAGCMLAAWPAYIENQADAARAAALPTPAPVLRDYEERGKLVAFWEGAVREGHRNDMFSPRQLAAQYLARYREAGDIDDVIRARAMAQRSLAIMPRNVAALSEMAAIELTLHHFRPALRDVDALLQYDAADADFLAQRAGLQMELGDYAGAETSLRRIVPADRSGIAAETVRARYDELTGHLAAARSTLDDAMRHMDALMDEPAQARAWYHVRAGEMAFAAGDVSAALSDERDALDIFPTDNLAFKDLAKFELAMHDDRAALAAATAGARVTPFAETLGYEADAQAALGDPRAAAATRDVIFAIERIGNAYHVNDRLLAVYYADHGLRPADALAIARREAAVRGDEIYAQDTLAWAAAMDGRWDEARRASMAALRFDTEDPLLQFHAGIIALHAGERDEAKRRLRRALALNPHFHPRYASDAQRILTLL